jgi:FkbM family methyltransferase
MTTRGRVESLLQSNPQLFSLARRAEVYASALLHRVHDNEFRATSAFADPRVIADVGANLGQSIAAFAGLFPNARFRAFEPNPICESTIRTVARLARVEASVHVCGLGNHNGYLDFYVPVVTGMSLLQEGSFDPNVFSHPVTIQRIGSTFALDVSRISVQRLDEYNDVYDLIKIDAQGFELSVLQGSAGILQRYKPVVFVENGPETFAVDEFLAEFGYKNATPSGLTLNSIFVRRS